MEENSKQKLPIWLGHFAQLHKEKHFGDICFWQVYKNVKKVLNSFAFLLNV